MQAMPPPPGFAATRWRRACQDAVGLLVTHGAELLAAGWSAADTFGLHVTAPGDAVDCYGLALLLDGGRVTELTADAARIMRPSGTTLSVQRGAGRPAVPAWVLDSRSAVASSADAAPVLEMKA